MSDHDQDSGLQIEGDVEGNVSVAGGDIINQQTTINIGQRLPRWLIGTGIIFLVGVFFVLVLAFNIPQRLGLVRPIKPAREDEVLIIVTDFTGSGEVVAHQRIYDSLSTRIAESNLQDVRVERLPGVTPESTRDAVEIGEEYGATLIIWGFADSLGLQPRYEVVKNDQRIFSTTDIEMAYADLPTFSAYIIKDIPNEFEYLMLFSLGQIALFSDDDEIALTYFDEAASIDVGNRSSALDYFTLYTYRTIALLDLGRINESLDSFNSAVSYNPQLVTLSLGMNTPFDPEAHLTELDSILEDNPEDVSALVAKSRDYYLLFDTESALEYASQAIELDPEFSDAYHMQALSLAALGDASSAISALEKAIEIDDADDVAYGFRGFVNHVLLEDFETALIDYNTALELNPNLVIVYALRGAINDVLGNYEVAVSDYQQFLSLYPFDSDAVSSIVQFRIADIRD